MVLSGILAFWGGFVEEGSTLNRFIITEAKRRNKRQNKKRNSGCYKNFLHFLL